MKKNITLLALGCCLPLTVSAEQLWSDNSFSVLYGGNYEMIPSGRRGEAHVLTLEHTSGHSWGSLFFFVDRIQSAKEAYRETYGELSPNIKLIEVGGFIKRINAAFTYEFGSSTTRATKQSYSQDNYLAGFGADLDIPGVDLFNVSIYRAQDNNVFGKRYDNQLSFSGGWHYGNFIMDGFLDYTPGRNGDNTELNFTPQLTYNFGPLLGLKNKLKFGIEYAYWRNKFRSDETQHNAAAIIKWHL
ncbi:Hypothetical protein HDN1F_12700 [gamma proteobacterium HdN1]|nr:Hypothetical protein HDN1F_12700 [gamma proteobacterium HdN1]